MGGRAAGLLSHRWWPVRDGVATSIARRFVVESRGAACRVTGASEAVTVAGDAVNGAAPLLNQDEIVAADLRFRFRRLPGRGL